MLLINKHETIYGTTQSGKTTYGIRKGREWDGGVFLWNAKRNKAPGYTKVDHTISIEKLKDLLKRGKKLNYLPILDLEQSKKELKYISQEILNAHMLKEMKKTLGIFDECQLYARSGVGSNPVENVATMGLGVGYVGIFITQRPALISNTLFTQSEIKTYLKIEEEEWEYFKKQNVPIEKIQKELAEYGEFSYINKYNGKYSAPKKI